MLWATILSLAVATPLPGIGGQPIPRKILALYKSSEHRTEEFNEISQRIQLVLNNLGLVVIYADAEGPLPDIATVEDYIGVISYFYNDGMQQASRYRRWLLRVLDAGKKVVVFGNLGAFRELQQSPTARDHQEIQRLYRRLGLTPPTRSQKVKQAVIRFKLADYYDFERELSGTSISRLTSCRSVSSENRVVLTVEANGLRNDAVVLGPWGGYVQSGFDFFLNEQTGRIQWYLNPIRFLETALGLSSQPRVDLNVVGGRRLAFIHIDGDGFRSISKIDNWSTCGEMMKDRVFAAYDLPFAVSVITADVDPALFGSPALQKLAKSLFALPNVEPASHGFAHPFDWRKGTVAYDSIPGYRFDPYREVVGSMQYIRKHLVSHRPVELFFWTGMGNPTEEVIALLEKNGWLNINGRAGFLDPEMASISSFAPPYTQVGTRQRINARISNEYEFTNHWQPPYEAYRDIIRTLAFTGDFGPLTPANIYLHFYIMEYPESWQALKDVLQWCLQQDWAFVYTSDYVRMVNDFLTLELEQDGERAILVRNAGHARTLRFPNTSKVVDMARSEHVTGYSRLGSDLLVYLDAHRRHRIVLNDQPSPYPSLSDFNMLVDSLDVRDQGRSARLWVRGYGRFAASLRYMPPSACFRLQIRSLDPPASQPHSIRVPKEIILRTTKDGTLEMDAFVQNHAELILHPARPAVYWYYRLRFIAFIALVFAGLLIMNRRGWFQRRVS